MRKVTIWATKGKKKSVIESDATVWEDLRNQISDAGYDMTELRATENVNKTTLEHKEAALPAGDFTIFLRPIKTKSGGNYDSMSFKELRAELTDADKEQLKVVLKGRNWTQAKTAELKDYLNSREEIPASTSVEEVKAEKISDESNISKMQRVKAILKDVQETYDDSDDEDEEEVYGMLANLIDDVDPILDLIKAIDNSDATTKALAEEADEFLAGFDD